METKYKSTKEMYNDFISEICLNRENEISLCEKYINLKKILDRFTKYLTEGEALQFPSLFSRVVFIAQKFNLSRKHEWELQNIRVKYNFLLKDSNNVITESQYKRANQALINLIDVCCKSKIVEIEDAHITLDDTNTESRSQLLNKNYKRVQVVDIEYTNYIIKAISTDNENHTIQIKYNIPNVNDLFNTTIDEVWINAQLNIIDYKIDSNGFYIPKIIVLEPDYLIDASALAECFQSYGHTHLHYYRKKFEQISNSQHLLLGNLANYFLDELIFTENIDNLNFKDSFIEAFKLRPFEFTSCSDISNISDFKQFMQKANNQFNNIKRVVSSDFKNNHIDINSCSLEPSFFSEKYGFQGRLDLLQLDDNRYKNLKIIELKSGSLPYPKTDTSKIAINHEVQASIYRMIIEGVYNVDNRTDISAAIMYSAADNRGENLRYAASYQKLDKEIINTRNQIIITEHNLYTEKEKSAEELFSQISNIDNYGRCPQFFIQQIANFKKSIYLLTDLEKKYLYRFIAFIARELYIQKIGDDGIDTSNSSASLWNTNFIERQEAFDLISDLEINQIDDNGKDLKISFTRKNTSDFVNFREGELCILYPHEVVGDTVLTNQIMKGTISKITKEEICLRFRYKQKNKKYFEIHKSWAVEHDRLDHSYNNMYKSLFQFCRSPQSKRDLILGITQPNSDGSKALSKTPTNLNNNERQALILDKAIAAKDYFLLVGPPGTGKTSIYAKTLIEHYYHHTNQDILIIAYTNRAVDELCESINQAFNISDQSCKNYIRIGTELSCDPKYRHRLLQNISSGVKSREELRNMIKDQRIVIGTLASIIGKPELFDIKHFSLSIIDEASQILEPQIVGILPQVDKFIMIGDHKQLSTITLQNKVHSKVEDDLLDIIKLYDCSESLFERLYRICENNNWTHSYDTLVYQGRMHTEIAKFPNENFYDNILLSASPWQTEALNNKNDSDDPLSAICAKQRLHFFDVKATNTNLNDKVNLYEAELVVDLCKTIINICIQNNITFDPDKTLGIITPYRNQIALIKHMLNETNIKELENIMIDTVERFQGSQRDIIIVSFCINKRYQLESFANMNSDGSVDRKLNVALTRARKQLYLIGDKALLKQNILYKHLIEAFDQTISNV